VCLHRLQGHPFALDSIPLSWLVQLAAQKRF
jgi:hypothetical protein